MRQNVEFSVTGPDVSSWGRIYLDGIDKARWLFTPPHPSIKLTLQLPRSNLFSKFMTLDLPFRS